MLTRRSFLTRVFGGAAALVIAQLPAPLLAHVDEVYDPLDIETTDTVWHSFHALVKLFLEERAKLGWPIQPSDVYKSHQLGAMLGDVVADVQLGVDCEGLNVDRYGVPMITHLAQATVDRGLDRFGSLECPTSVDKSIRFGPLRWSSQYDVISDRYLSRIDVLGGSSPAGRKRRERDRQHRLVLSIKRKRGLIVA